MVWMLFFVKVGTGSLGSGKKVCDKIRDHTNHNRDKRSKLEVIKLVDLYEKYLA